MEAHKFDILSFVFGALFLAFTASVVWDLNYDLGFDIGDWILPIALLMVGIGLLVTGVRSAITKKDDQPKL